MDIESNGDKSEEARKNQMEEESPIDKGDIFERILNLHISEKEVPSDQDHQSKTSRKYNKRNDFRKILNSSSSNQRLIPSSLKNDSSRQNSERARNFYETQNSLDQESFRKSFKKRQNQSISVERTIRDSSSQFSEMSQSRSFHQILPNQYKDEQMISVQEKRLGCNCKKSKCLKLYCECFQRQKFCNEFCKCYDCGNHAENSDKHKKAVMQALARNARGFQQQEEHQQKVKGKQGFSLGVQIDQVKKGCKCKRTHCVKKYCECYGGGTVCGVFCRCEDCFNTSFHLNKK